MQNDIKDTSNHGIYHNKRFKALAEMRDLRISRHGKYGWMITEPTEQLLDFCISNQLEDIQIVRQTLLSPIRVPGNHPTVISPRKPSSRSISYFLQVVKITNVRSITGKRKDMEEIE